jgi:hypothetical protein
LSFHSQHHTLARLETLLGADASSYFRFTIVRDPVDRFLSAFAYLRGRRQSTDNLVISQHDHLASEMIASSQAWQDDPLVLLQHFATLSSWESAPLHFRPQAYFLGGAQGIMRFDVVMRVESLLEDLQQVLQSHDFGETADAASSRLPCCRPSSSDADIQRWRTPALEHLARQVYAEDYTTLGY